MESKKLIRYLLTEVEPRKEILEIAYGNEEVKRKKIEYWINTEMLAMLFKKKGRNEVETAEGEHNYDILKTGPKGGKKYPRCDLWWVHDDLEHWLEVKTIIFHRNTRGLNKHYKDRITDDLDKEQYLMPSNRSYHLHHLLIIFDDKKYNNGNWIEDVYSLYGDYKWNIGDKWTLELDESKTLNFFLHGKSKKSY